MRRLGQHFLKNKKAVRDILAALDPAEHDIIIEIGAGKGALTLPLAETCRHAACSVIAIEKDEQLAKQLKNYAGTEVGQFKNLEIINGDALKLIPKLIEKLEIGNWKLAGNIPYYITGKLLRALGESNPRPSCAVLMLQREVAERIAAAPPRMNLLAAAVQIWAEPKIIRLLQPEDFSPPPKVESAIVKLATGRLPLATREELKKYYHLIKILFKQPRKTVWNNLRDGLEIQEKLLEKTLADLKISKNARPQNLPLDLLIKLAANI